MNIQTNQNNPYPFVDIMETLPTSLHRAYLCTSNLLIADKMLQSANSPIDLENAKMDVTYWKCAVSRQICEAFKMDNNLRFADLDSLAAGDELLISVIRSTLRGII